MKCEICKEKIEDNFLGKIFGTFINKKPICSRCQKTLTLEEIKERL